MKLKDKIKQRYAIIYNTYANSEIAKRFSSFSDKKIYILLGIKIPQKATTIRETKTFTKQEKARRFREYIWFVGNRYLLEIPQARIKAKRASKKPPKLIELEARMKKVRFEKQRRKLAKYIPSPEGDPEIIESITDPKEVMNFLETESRKGNKQKRKNRWAWWSDEFHGHDFPLWLKDIIMRVNLHKNLDPLSPYGFCVIYKIYVERYTETEAIAFVNPDKYGDYLYDYLKQKRFTRRKKKR